MKESTMRNLCISLIAVVIFILVIPLGTNISSACENRVSTTMGEYWTDPYLPCGSKLIWKLSYVCGPEGSSSVKVMINGAGVEKEIAAGEFGWPTGKTGDTVYFTPGNYHSAMIDYMPSVGDPGIESATLIIDYFEDMPD
jgi:hypothetical protein